MRYTMALQTLHFLFLTSDHWKVALIRAYKQLIKSPQSEQRRENRMVSQGVDVRMAVHGDGEQDPPKANVVEPDHNRHERNSSVLE